MGASGKISIVQAQAALRPPERQASLGVDVRVHLGQKEEGHRFIRTAVNRPLDSLPQICSADLPASAPPAEGAGFRAADAFPASLPPKPRLVLLSMNLPESRSSQRTQPAVPEKSVHALVSGTRPSGRKQTAENRRENVKKRFIAVDYG